MNSKLERLGRKLADIVKMTTGLRRASLQTRKLALEKQRAKAAKEK